MKVKIKTDRRSTTRRAQDKAMEAKMLALENSLDNHVLDCSRNAKETLAALTSMNTRFDAYHVQNQGEIRAIRVMNEDQLVVLNAIVTAKKVSVWAGGVLKWLLGLLASAAGAMGLYNYFKP